MPVLGCVFDNNHLAVHVSTSWCAYRIVLTLELTERHHE